MDGLNRKTIALLAIVLTLMLAWTFGNLLYSFRQISASRADTEENATKEFDTPAENAPTLPVDRKTAIISIILIFSVWFAYSSRESKNKVLVIGAIGVVLTVLAIKYGTIKRSVDIDGGGGTPGGSGGDIGPTKIDRMPLDRSFIIIGGLVLAVLAVLLYQKMNSKEKPGKRNKKGTAGSSTVEQEFSDTLEQAISELEGGKDVRTTIIRCHLQMRYILKDKGVDEEGYMTPREIEEKALEKLTVDRKAISDLTELFEEARYSSHRLREDERERAIADLEAFQNKLGVEIW